MGRQTLPTCIECDEAIFFWEREGNQLIFRHFAEKSKQPLIQVKDKAQIDDYIIIGLVESTYTIRISYDGKWRLEGLCNGDY